MPDTVSLRVRIEGRVQGVWYRGWAIQQASVRSLSGWVRNRMDGSVEALFSGPDACVQDMLAACRHGPPAALVTAVHVEPAEAPQQPGFCQKPTE
ncbi:MAG TPA: acylphosphatase [Patescibacteria group bacterium]|nr:acylphosphatase [Patescibacteria group bacterium]